MFRTEGLLQLPHRGLQCRLRGLGLVIGELDFPERGLGEPEQIRGRVLLDDRLGQCYRPSGGGFGGLRVAGRELGPGQGEKRKDVEAEVGLDRVEEARGLGELGSGLWFREVSPSPSVATFSDASSSHPFYQFIEALAKAGVTGGCGGKYCPDSPLARGQMATFLSRALGLQWP